MLVGLPIYLSCYLSRIRIWSLKRNKETLTWDSFQSLHTSAIYFRNTLVDLDKVYIEPGFEGLLDIGTDAGGCIEIFANENDVKNRDTYLAGFDGGILSSGGHYIIGTVLIRTSNALTGTQQLELTDAIKEALLKVIH